MTALVDDLYAVQQSVGDDARQRADRLSHDAETSLAVYLVAGAPMAALVAGLAAFASRSLTRPLSTLAEAAHQVARHRLPATGGFLMVGRVRDGSCLGVIAAEGCDIGLVGYEMAVLADRAGEPLTPQLVRDLNSAPLAPR